MNAMDAALYLILQRDLGLLGNHAALTRERDRVGVLGMGLRLAGFECYAYEQAVYLSSGSKKSSVVSMLSLCVPLDSGRLEYVGLDGSIGTQAIRQALVSGVEGATPSEVDDEHWSPILLRRTEDISSMEQSMDDRDRICAALVRLCAATLHAHQLAINTPDCAPAQVSPRRM